MAAGNYTTTSHKPYEGEMYTDEQLGRTIHKTSACGISTVDMKGNEMADTREVFEIAFKLTQRQAWRTKDGTGYQNPEIQAKWEGWQAGLAKAAPTEQEPVEYQHRMRATWRNEGEGWTPWEKCSAGHYEDCIKTPLLHDWQHEVRKLYTAPVAAAAPGADERKPVAWHVTVSLHDDVMRDELTQAEPSAEHMRRLESAGYETTVTPLFR